MRRPLATGGRTVAGAFVVAAVLLVFAAPVSAHAQLESTQPAPSSVVLEPPRQIVLHFGEPVEVDFGALRVLGPDGRRVDQGGAHHPGDDSHAVAVAVAARLARGTYVVAWRVISADSHPVQGGFVFSVGTAAGATRARSVAQALAGAGGSGTVGVLYGILRFVLFAALLTLVGTAAAVELLDRPAARLRAVRALLWTSWAVLLFGSVAGIALQGVYAAALPLGRALSASLFDDVVRTRFGTVQLLRCGLLVAATPLLVRWTRSGATRRPPSVIAAAAVALGLLATPGLAGHASTTGNGAVGEALDVVHLGAAALWSGGLVLLLVRLLGGRRDAAAPEAGALGRRFSPYAAGAVVAVVASGVLQSLRQVGSRYALVHTPYGRLVFAKAALVALLVLLGLLTRRRFVGRRAPAGADGRARRPVVAELLALSAVLALTAALVAAVPARQAAAAPFSRTFSVLGLEVNAVVAPGRVGSDNELHVYVLGPGGQPRSVPELDATVALPTAGIGPVAVPLVVASPGHYQAARLDLPVGGMWELTLTVRTTAIDEEEVHARLPVH